MYHMMIFTVMYAPISFLDIVAYDMVIWLMILFAPSIIALVYFSAHRCVFLYKAVYKYLLVSRYKIKLLKQ